MNADDRHIVVAEVDIVELGGVDQRVDRGGATAAFVGAREGPVVTADRERSDRPLGGDIDRLVAILEGEGLD